VTPSKRGRFNGGGVNPGNVGLVLSERQKNTIMRKTSLRSLLKIPAKKLVRK